jgi:hypothetical protein
MKTIASGLRPVAFVYRIRVFQNEKTPREAGPVVPTLENRTPQEAGAPQRCYRGLQPRLRPPVRCWRRYSESQLAFS